MATSLLNTLGALGGMAGAAAGIKNPNDQYVSFLKSNSIEDALIERFKLMDRYKADYKQDARKTLEGSVKIASGKDGIIIVSADDHDPQFAADLANAHVQELTKLMGRLAVTEAQQRRQFFEQQLKGAKDKLAAAEIALGETGVNASVLKSNPASAMAAVATLQAQVTAQEVKLGAMRGYLAESAPEFKQAMTELLNLRAQLAKQSQDRGAEPKAGQGDYINRYRDFKYQETLFELFARQFEMAKLDEAREGATIQVVDAAQPPERKSKPKKALIAIIATLASGFALLLVVFVRQAFFNSSKDPEIAFKVQQIKAAWYRAIKSG